MLFNAEGFEPTYLTLVPLYHVCRHLDVLDQDYNIQTKNNIIKLYCFYKHYLVVLTTTPCLVDSACAIAIRVSRSALSCSSSLVF